MGLLDYSAPNADLLTPAEKAKLQNSMLLNLGLGLLSSSGPSRMPTSFGQGFGNAAGSAMQQAQQMVPQLMNSKMMAARLADMQRLAPIKQALTQQIIGSYGAPQQPGQQPGMPSQPPQDMPPPLLMPPAPGPSQGPPPAGLLPTQGNMAAGPGPSQSQPPQQQAGLLPGVPGAQPVSSMTSGIDPLFALGALSDDPGLTKIGTELQKRLEPIVGQQGVWFRGPGNSLQLAPGYSKGIGENKQAEADVTNANTLVTVNLPGGPRQMTQAQALALANGGRTSTPTAPPGAAPAVAGSTAAPGYGAPAPSATPTPGGTPGTPLMTPKSETEQRAFGTSNVEMKKEIDDAASVAMESKARTNKMLQLLDSGEVAMGPAARQATWTRNALKEVLPAAVFNGLNLRDPSSSQEYAKYALQGATTVAKQQFGSRITQNEVNLMIQAFPGQTITEKANRAILGWGDMRNDRDILKQSAFYDYMNKSKPLEQFPGYFNQNYPLQGVRAPSAQTEIQPQGNAPVTSAPASQIVRTGMHNGRKVVQYKDGTVDYAP